MGGATGFLWLAVVILAMVWALQYTGTISGGPSLSTWLPVLLVLSILGAVFNMFVMPFIGRSRTTRTAASASGTTAPAAAAPGTVAPTTTARAAGAAEHEVVQETHDRPSL